MRPLLLILTFLLGSFMPAHAENPVSGGTLITTLHANPRHLNSAVQSGTVTGAVGAQVFAAPLRYDKNWTPQPYLATDWSWSSDGLSLTLNLRKNAVFHDGVPITSRDVAFSIQAIKENHPFKTMYEPVLEVETPDDHTAIIRLSRPHPALLLAMSSQLLSVIPEHIYGDGQPLSTHPRNIDNVVGSGPFRVIEYKRDQHVILERFDQFFIEERPHLDRIVMRIMKDPIARYLGLQKGEIHLSTFENSVRDILRLQSFDELEVTSEGYGAIGALSWLAFNTQRGPLSDVRVRRAIAHALDRDFIVSGLQSGVADRAPSPIHPDSPLHWEGIAQYPLDLAGANALLDEAGFVRNENDIRFSLTIDYDGAVMKPFAEYTKLQLAKVGIDVSVRTSPDFATWSNRVSNHDFDMTWDTVFNWGDPVIGVHRTYLSSNIRPGIIWSNTQQYRNDRVDDILAAAGSELDAEKRRMLYREFQTIVAEDVPVYWMSTVPYHTIHSRQLMNAPRGIWASSSPYDNVYFSKE